MGCELQRPIRPDPVIVVYLTFVSAITPGRFVADLVSRRAFQLALIEIDHIAAQVGVVFQDRPGQGMILVSHAEEPTEGHDG